VVSSEIIAKDEDDKNENKRKRDKDVIINIASHTEKYYFYDNFLK
jgi:hypothetical protein